VGVQKTALYYYFASKAALYGAVLTRMLEDFDRTVAEAIGAAGAPRERMERLLDALNDLLAERRNYSQILIRVFVDPVRLDEPRIRDLIETVVGRVLRFYREGVDAGGFRAMSSRHVLQTVLGSCIFHYASGTFGAKVLEVDDLFTRAAVSWRRAELKNLILNGVIPVKE
jgi:AcrR family transcriptional regulator